MSEKKATRVAYGEALVELGKKNDRIGGVGRRSGFRDHDQRLP